MLTVRLIQTHFVVLVLFSTTKIVFSLFQNVLYWTTIQRGELFSVVNAVERIKDLVRLKKTLSLLCTMTMMGS